MAVADPEFLQDAPNSDEVTPYDERHLVTYLRLLDAQADGADWREVVAIVFGLNPDIEHARQMHASHLARARWMSQEGYRQLAQRGHEKPRSL